jgi:hypothetical protein
MNPRLQKLVADTKSAFRTPTLKQKEAYGRLCHTFCAASVIGAVSVTFTETHITTAACIKVGGLIFWAALLLWTGALLSKGE